VRYSDTPPTLSNTVLFSTSYDPYGVPLFQEETLGTGQPFGYTGAVFDPDFQFHYLRARWYNPKSGRFLQRDSVRGALTTPTALYRYAYAHHNPLAYHDPTGHWAWPYWGLGQIFPLYEGGAGGLDWCAELAGVACGALPPPSIDDTGMLSVLVLTPFLGSLTGGAYIPRSPADFGRPFTPAELAAIRASNGGICAICGVRPGTTADHWPPNAFYRSELFVNSGLVPPGTPQFGRLSCDVCQRNQTQWMTSLQNALSRGDPLDQIVHRHWFQRLFPYWPNIFPPVP
jgi:RHS repeat-associated protein